jgi:hypothetical protein
LKAFLKKSLKNLRFHAVEIDQETKKAGFEQQNAVLLPKKFNSHLTGTVLEESLSSEPHKTSNFLFNRISAVWVPFHTT